VALEHDDPQPDVKPDSQPDTEPDVEPNVPPTDEPPADVGHIERARVAITRAGEKVRDARGRSQTIDSAFLVAEHDTDVGGGVLAGAVAYRLFLFIVPLAFFLVYGIGFGANVAGESPKSLATGLGVGSFIAKAVTGGSAQSEASRITIFIFAGFASVLGAHSALKVIRIVHGLVWRVRFPKMQHAWRATGVFLVVIAAALVVSAATAYIERTSRLGAVGGEIILYAVAFAVWLFISWKMPHTEGIPWTALVPGSLLFAGGVVIMRIATIYFFDNYLVHKSETYGAVAGSLVLLLWVYIIGRIVIASVVLNSTLASRPRPPT
jgi:uncharacterized BrkB/YihY/UPF0761 family membrane protein